MIVSAGVADANISSSVQGAVDVHLGVARGMSAASAVEQLSTHPEIPLIDGGVD